MSEDLIEADCAVPDYDGDLKQADTAAGHTLPVDPHNGALDDA